MRQAWADRSMIRASGRRPIRSPHYSRFGPNDVERNGLWFVRPLKFWPLWAILLLARTK